MDVAKKLFVLDTSVLLHDPQAIYRFAPHDVAISITVLKELDRKKTGVKLGDSDVAQNAREVSRIITNITGRNAQAKGTVVLPNIGKRYPTNGGDSSTESQLIIITAPVCEMVRMLALDEASADDRIIAGAKLLSNEYLGHAYRDVVLVSNDNNMRIQADALGVHVEDYQSDMVIKDTDVLETGLVKLHSAYWEHLVAAGGEGNPRKLFRLKTDELALPAPVQINNFLYGDGRHFIVRQIHDDHVLLERSVDYSLPQNNVAGICARSAEQIAALNLLMDPTIPFVTLIGRAGTGKSLMTAAAAVAQNVAFDMHSSKPPHAVGRYRKAVVTRAMVPVDTDPGALPGDEPGKGTPWHKALYDNLEIIAEALTEQVHRQGNGRRGKSDGPTAGTENTKRAQQQQMERTLAGLFEVNLFAFVRGRSYTRAFVTVDEVQNLTPHQAKTIGTRIGLGSKIVVLGNFAQLDNKYLSPSNCGLAHVAVKLYGNPLYGHVILQHGERSPVADMCERCL